MAKKQKKREKLANAKKRINSLECQLICLETDPEELSTDEEKEVEEVRNKIFSSNSRVRIQKMKKPKPTLNTKQAKTLKRKQRTLKNTKPSVNI
jgi:hypothetical protein